MRVSTRRSIDAAMSYARRGWAVFPTHAIAWRTGACTCGEECSSPGKHPRTKHGLKNASTDLDRVESWWYQWPRSNVGIRTGERSGIIVLDIDPEHGGDVALERLLSEHGPLPAGRTVRTGGGGRHLYFKHPGTEIPNSASRIGPGIDIRGDGGYVLAPPSNHKSKSRYVLLRGGGVVPAAPEWLLDVARRPEPVVSMGERSTVANATAWGRAAFEGELDRLRHAPQGARNDTLNRVAFRLGAVIRSGGLSEGEVTEALLREGMATGLRQGEVASTVAGALRAARRSESSADPPMPFP